MSKKQLNMCKELWDIFISDEAFREYYSGTPSHDLTIKDTSPITHTKGTLYIPPAKKGGEGHFIAYQMNKNTIEIFDSSAYAYQQFQNDPRLHQSIINRSKKTMIKLNIHPQDLCIGDTFCQTWSLGWIKPKLRQFTENVKTQKGSIHSMYNIVHTVANSHKFSEYLMYNVNQFNKLVEQTRKKFDVKLCSINNILDFINFSKNITEEQIGLIMMNKT